VTVVYERQIQKTMPSRVQITKQPNAPSIDIETGQPPRNETETWELLAIEHEGIFMWSAKEMILGVFRLSWKWRERSTVKITERTREKSKEALHSRREGRRFEAAFIGAGAGLQAL
jgi:hypothetical protein